MNKKIHTVLTAAIWTLLVVQQVTSADMINETGPAAGGMKTEGGLIVQIGFSDPAELVKLRVDEKHLVHGLDADPQKVAKAREYIQSKGLYGKVSVDVFAPSAELRAGGKKLPYVDNLVNGIIVKTDTLNVTIEEIKRVLAPNGVALINGKRIQKPVPTDIDNWTHFLHDETNNGLGHDRQAGPPKRLRWIAGPKWSRSHEYPTSVGGVVAEGGRIFTILDEAPAGVFEKLPQKFTLIARDAFSGVLLWKIPLKNWQQKDGTGTGNRWHIHQTIPRRLVAKDGLVYMTLQFNDSPVSVIDGATGKIVKELKGTEGTDEIVLSDGVLVTKMTKGVSVNAEARMTRDALKDSLAAIDVKTGKQLWRKESISVVPYTLAISDGKVVCHDMAKIMCFDLKSGKELWAAPNQIGNSRGGDSILVVSDGVVLFHGVTVINSPAKAASPADKKKAPGKKRGTNKQAVYMTAVSLEDGSQLWQQKATKGWVAAGVIPADVFVSKGIVYCGGQLQGRDLKTGEVVKQLKIDNLISPGHHYRCHRSRATERYLILPKRGAEFIDLEGENHMRNDWLRAPCYTASLPANGLFYAPSDQCFCYPGVKVCGYLAFSADIPEKLTPSTDANLKKGPAYGKPTPASGHPSGGGDPADTDAWPRYRRDLSFSGSTKTEVPADVQKIWDVKLASKGAQPVIVGDRLWVSEKDAQRIRCLDIRKGKDIWTYTAGGRIDSAPTIHDGMVLFGCRDGCVYCLRASDGALVWKFRAAPDVRTVSFEQVESLWPVHGSVCVVKDTVYFTAGRSSFLDGGILVYGLDAKTGKVKCSHLLEGPWPDIKKDTGTPFDMEGALPDLIVSDGNNLFMGRIKFDLALNRFPVKRETSLGALDMGATHLVATGGFLDDTGYDRIYWMYSKRWPGFYLAQFSPKAGQLVVFDDTTTYAVKYFYRRHLWSPKFFPEEDGYLLFADDNDNEPVWADKDTKVLDWLPKGATRDSFRHGGRNTEKGTGYSRAKPSKWQEMIPLRIRAMVLANDQLFAAGLPDVVDPEDPLASFEGRKGALLNVYSAKDGRLIKSQKLPAPVAFDGMIAVGGRLYMATEDNRLICMGE